MKRCRLLSALFLVVAIVAGVRAEPGLAQEPTEAPLPSPSPSPATAESPDTAEINVKNAELETVIRIFSRKTKRNYLLDERVKGKISIFLPGKISIKDASQILDQVLAMKGFTSVPIGDNLFKIVPSREAKQSTVPTLTESRDSAPSAAVVTRLLPLKHVNADDIRQLVGQLVSPEGLVNSYQGTNSLILIDSEDNIARIVSIVESLDVPFSDQELTIIPIRHADAQALAETLKEILGAPSSGSSSTGSSDAGQPLITIPQVNQVSGQPSGALPVVSGPGTRAIAGRAREPKIIPDERTNSLVIVADDGTTLRIKALVAQLDSEVDLSGSGFWVYRCQHAKADELAEVLGGLVGEGGGSSRSSASSGSSSRSGSSNRRESPGLSSSGRNSNSQSRRSGSPFGGSNSESGSSSSRSGSESSGPSVIDLGEGTSVTADPATNSLIIRGSRADYLRIRELIKRLDVKRRQVLVEAVLLEVGVDERQDLGTQWLTSAGGDSGGVLVGNDVGSLINTLNNPSSISGLAAAAASAGTITLPGGITLPTQAVLVNALRNNSNVNVLSAPTILTTDNEEAQITVGQNIPFLASTSTNETNLNNTFNQIDREDIGIKLQLTPQISSNEFVTLRIFTEVSNVIDQTRESQLGPTTTIRTSETTVITKSGQMVVTGGLISDAVADAVNGVPYLMDIPVLGHLFKNRTETRRRTNLLIFITPKIVRDQFDHRDLTIAERDKMERAMAEFDIPPSRREILRRVEIDRVAEYPQTDITQEEVSRVPTGEPTPSTKPPQAISKTPTRMTAPRSERSPGEPASARVTLPSTPLPSSVKEQSAPTKQQRRGQAVVLEFEQQIPEGVRPPFEIQGGRVALQTTQREFFELGKRYLYTLGDKKFAATVVAVSDTPSPFLFSGAWHRLSPQEEIGLGSRVWQPE